MVSTAPIPSCCLQRLRKHRRRRRGDGLHGLLGRPQAPLLRGHHGHGLGIRGTLLPREDLLPVLGWAALFWGWVDGLGWVGMVGSQKTEMLWGGLPGLGFIGCFVGVVRLGPRTFGAKLVSNGWASWTWDGGKITKNGGLATDLAPKKH